MTLKCRILIVQLLLSSILMLACQAQSNTSEHIVSQEKQDIVEKLKENNHLSVERQVTLYRQLKDSYPEAYNFENEDQLTMYGYGMLWEGKPKDALLIFKLIAEQFPQSSNAYDSLGEAYYNLDDMPRALSNYQKSLKMNPDNYNAEDYIEKIKFPDKKEATLAELFHKIYSVNDYLDDLDDLGYKLFKTHPSIHKFTSKEDMEAIINSKKKLITEETTYAMFRWHCNEIIASVNCSHTGMSSFWVENEMLPLAKRFPLQTVWLENKLYVTDPLSNHTKISVQDEILSINGVEISVLMSQIYNHIPSQGHIESTKRLYFNNWTTGLIAYALGLPDKFSVEVKNRPQSIDLLPTLEHNDPLSKSIIRDCGEPLCLDFIDQSTALLSIINFVFYRWNNFDQFVKFIDESFIKINDQKIEHLIIDLRGNGGGAPEASIHLLQHLAKQAFTYFPNAEPIQGGGTWEPFEHAYKGKIYFLIDGEGNSTTGHFMAKAQEMNLGTIIGEELGSNQFCSAGQTIFKLKNTRMQFHSATNNNRVPTENLPDERGILPDHYVQQNIDEYLNDIDVVKEFALKLTKK